MALFSHVQLKVKGLKASKLFYDAIMSVLGYKVVLNIDNCVIGYGTYVHDMLEISQAGPKFLLSQSVHIALNATSKQAVNDFYLAALQQGGQCHGKPGFWPQYEPGYYAAFVIDPDGHNIEAVYKEKQ